jgi:hypothetical protein
MRSPFFLYVVDFNDIYERVYVIEGDVDAILFNPVNLNLSKIADVLMVDGKVAPVNVDYESLYHDRSSRGE